MLLQYIALTHCRWSWRLWNNYRKPKIFTKHELHSAYNLVCIREGDESKTAFHTTRGHYEYLVMPYGLSNAPAVFQSFINKIFKDLIDRCVIAYIYDILIYSSSYDIRHVKTVLAHLCQRQLYIKAEKCELHKNFLGYIISQKGVEMDTSKVKAVTDWPEPTTIKCSSSWVSPTSIARPSRQIPTGLLEPLHIPSQLWSHMAVDFITKLHSWNGYNTILDAIDRFSKACQLMPLNSQPTAMETASTLFNQVFHTYGLPKDIVLDNGPQFTSRVWKAFCTPLGINVSLSAAPDAPNPSPSQKVRSSDGSWGGARNVERPLGGARSRARHLGGEREAKARRVGGSEDQGEASGGNEDQGEASGGNEDQGEASGGNEDQGEASGGNEDQGEASGGNEDQGEASGGNEDQGEASGGNEDQGEASGGNEDQGEASGGNEDQGEASGGSEKQERDKWGEQRTRRQGQRVRRDVHSRAEAPNEVHSRAAEPNDVHSRAAGPSNVHRRAAASSDVHRRALAPSDVHRRALAPSDVHRRTTALGRRCPSR
ncbi:hypothetical protein QTP70_019847 [Hemibagrus guttatus]|uniref:ribonuclease H n=1 Tax=Hemibagrus guttatus TaxID=175788 RepID=A0AAE0V3G9_9TELE|nr:hypothetical protein QTP70_019847 [Hemibagrus guttatus]